MKKIALLTAVVLVLCITLCACGKSDEVSEVSEARSMPDYIDIVADDSDVEADAVSSDSEALAGGWTTPEDGAITDEAQAAFDKAEKPGGIAYTPVALLGTQVVAGTNYAFVCIGKPTAQNAKPSPYLVIVYADLEGGTKILSAKPIEVKQ